MTDDELGDFFEEVREEVCRRSTAGRANLVTRAVFDCVILLQAAGRPTGPPRHASGPCGTAASNFSSARHSGRGPGRAQPAQDAPEVPGPHARGGGRVPGGRREPRDDAAHGAQGLCARPRPKDEPYVDLAVATGARYLISRDKIYWISWAMMPSGSNFRLTVIDPVALLRELALAHPNPEADRGAERTKRRRKTRLSERRKQERGWFFILIQF